MKKEVQMVVNEKLREYYSLDTDKMMFSAVGGGSINDTYKIELGRTTAFCKVNDRKKFPGLFLKEMNGLRLIEQQKLIHTPMVIDCFNVGDEQILLLEWITEGERNNVFWKNFGEQLAAMHKISAPAFGLEEDNYMGSVPQKNAHQTNWIDFFIQQRLQPLLDKCQKKGELGSTDLQQFEVLFLKLAAIFDAGEKPSLLHGDLWSGNFMCNKKNEPVLIDPAVYYGHRSMDLALTTLFGGFASPFYDAYNHHFPFPPNYKEQWQVCNLYPLLIHLYLFGSSYLPQIKRTLQQFT